MAEGISLIKISGTVCIPLNVAQGDATLSAVLNLSYEDEMIGLEHLTCVEPCFIDGSPTAAVQDEVAQTGTPNTVEPCDADNSHAAQGKESDATNDKRATSIISGDWKCCYST